MMIPFIWRNRGKVGRSLSATRRAMKRHIAANPDCAFCGRRGPRRMDAHHIIPVSVRPDLADVPSNLVTLCAGRCHLTVGHFNDYRHHNPAVLSLCRTASFTRATISGGLA